MKYCRNCGTIYAESYEDYENDKCCYEHFPLIEDQDMTEEKFLKLTEEEKDNYELHIIELCKQSGYFNEHDCQRGKHYDYYYGFRFDKYTALSGEEPPIKKNLTPDEQAIEEWKSRQRINDAVSNYIATGGINNQLKCPYCKSTNVKKISGASRLISTGLFGLGSKKVGKTHECRSCGSMW